VGNQVNLSDITNQFVDCHYFPCHKFAGLHNDIYQYQHFHERVHVCEQWLLQHFKPRPTTQFDQALSLIYQSFGTIKVAQLATMVGWSRRHLNRLFQRHTGLDTKIFSQITAFSMPAKSCTQLLTTL